jgi:hypothetical protein
MCGISLKETATCGCEQRRQWLNSIDAAIRSRWSNFVKAVQRYRKPLAFVDVDVFESPWAAIADSPGASYRTANQDWYDTLMLSGYVVEMKDAK